MGSQKVRNAKENSRMHKKCQKYPQLGKRHKDPQSIPNGSKTSIILLSGSKVAKETTL